MNREDKLVSPEARVIHILVETLHNKSMKRTGEKILVVMPSLSAPAYLGCYAA